MGVRDDGRCCQAYFGRPNELYTRLQLIQKWKYGRVRANIGPEAAEGVSLDKNQATESGGSHHTAEPLKRPLSRGEALTDTKETGRNARSE